MKTLVVACFLTVIALGAEGSSDTTDRGECPDYSVYSRYPHPPYSEGDRRLPYQRPSEECRTFRSWVIEKVIEDVTSRMSDPDLARLFENTFPSTTDTTIKFHIDDKWLGVMDVEAGMPQSEGKWQGPHTFVITGDINAEWLRDSTNQLALYHPLANLDPSLRTMLLGAINTQSEYVIESPYCNAFQPPPISSLTPTSNGQDDTVHPAYEPSFVFECKYELDSLAHFLALGNRFYENTGSAEFVNPRWVVALETILRVIEEQSLPTFHPVTGQHIRNEYTFQRRTELGTETLNLGGIGNPLNNGTGLVRSAFRPSDDATILGFLVPANAMMAVELRKTGQMLEAENKLGMAKKLLALSQTISDGIWRHAVIKHPKYGEVFAYELDGYGSHILMDDANYPSLLALPLMGFVERNDQVYQNTRRMLLSQSSNPYFLTGRDFHGIGGPHIGVNNAWPMSLLIQAQTSEDDEEIEGCLQLVLQSARLGLMHESVDVNHIASYTRSWFAWCNGVFAATILDLARRKPHIIFTHPTRYDGPTPTYQTPS